MQPHYAVGNSITKPNDQKIRQYKGYSTSDDRGTARFIDPLGVTVGAEMTPGAGLSIPEGTKVTVDPAGGAIDVLMLELN